MVFVNAVVAEVHAGVPQVFAVRVVLDSRQSHQPLLVQVDYERVVARHQHVQPQVALVARDQQRVLYVLGDHHAFL